MSKQMIQFRSRSTALYFSIQGQFVVQIGRFPTLLIAGY